MIVCMHRKVTAGFKDASKEIRRVANVDADQEMRRMNVFPIHKIDEFLSTLWRMSDKWSTER